MKKLKQQEGKDLVLFGGASLAQAFVERDLIDEYRLVVHPVLLGQGKSLFQENKNKLALKLIQAKAFQAGAMLFFFPKNLKEGEKPPGEKHNLCFSVSR